MQYGLTHNYGGIEKIFYNIFGAINKENFLFDYVTLGNALAYEKEVESMGGEIHKLNVEVSSNPIQNRLNYYRGIMDFFKHNADRYDVVHCSVVNMTYILPVVLSAKFYGVPKIIIHAHNSSFTKDTSSRVRLEHEINKMIVSFLATDFVAASKQAAEFMYTGRRVKLGNYRIMRNPINIDRFIFNEANRNNIRKELKITNDFIVGHVGTLDPLKNHEFLLEIFYEIQKEKPASKLMMVGQGELKDSIIEQATHLGIEDKLLWIGMVENPAPYLHAMDAFVFPSFSEGFGNVLIEAQVAQLPCFVSDSVPQEVKVTDTLEFLSIKEEPAIWAKKIMNYTKKTSDQTVSIKKQGFSIKESIKSFEALYRTG